MPPSRARARLYKNEPERTRVCTNARERARVRVYASAPTRAQDATAGAPPSPWPRPSRRPPGIATSCVRWNSWEPGLAADGLGRAELVAGCACQRCAHEGLNKVGSQCSRPGPRPVSASDRLRFGAAPPGCGSHCGPRIAVGRLRDCHGSGTWRIVVNMILGLGTAAVHWPSRWRTRTCH